MGRGLLSIVLLVWLAAVLGGFAVLLVYKSTPAAAASAPPEWPSESRIERSDERATLLMFVHPHCECSRASVAELGRMLSRTGSRVTARVVFIRPRGTPRGWERSSLRDRVRALGLAIVDDAGGIEARRFGASASGTCVLYDERGGLMFAGGITALRGHEGNSLGQERIVTLLARGTVDRRDSPVFGCDLEDPPQGSE